MVWVGRDLKDHLVPNPLSWVGRPFNQTKLLKAPSSLALNISSLNLVSLSLKTLPLVLSLHALIKSPSHLSYSPSLSTQRPQ